MPSPSAETSRQESAASKPPGLRIPGAGSGRRTLGHVRNLLLAAGSLAATFIVLEVVCRLIVPTSPPGTTYGRPIERNSLGLRDREFAVPKPAGVERVLVLGDSFTWGVGLDVETTTPKLLQALLAEEGRHVEVVNAADPGHNTVEELERLRELGPLYEPDAVLVIYNLNDIEYRPELAFHDGGDPPPLAEAAVPVVEIDPGEEITRFSKNAGLRGLILAFERRSVLVRILVPRVGTLLRQIGFLKSVEFSWVEKIFQGFTEENPGWLESRRALGGIADYCAAADCEVVVAVYPLLVELESYQGEAAHRAVASFCQARGIEVVDLLPIFAGTRARSHWINFIDSHPDAEAHAAVARELLPTVRSSLSQAAARTAHARGPSGEKAP